jgi:hypothetical protein
LRRSPTCRKWRTCTTCRSSRRSTT